MSEPMYGRNEAPQLPKVRHATKKARPGNVILDKSSTSLQHGIPARTRAQTANWTRWVSSNLKEVEKYPKKIMFRRSLLRAPARPPPSPSPPQCAIRNRPVRHYTTPTSASTSQSRIERFNRRLPRFLHKYTNALGNAPVTHITSFLILHELTAVIPLFGLAGYFHYTHWLPPWIAEGAWVAAGVERFGRYFRRKGWIRSEEADEAEREADEMRKMRGVDKSWKVGEGGVRLVVEFATAYAVVKMLLVPRIVFSVWATPGFARGVVTPVLGWFRRLFGRKKVAASRAEGAGTGAVGGGAVPKNGSGKS